METTMTNVLKTTLATAFAAACLAGTSVAFAADNNGTKGKDTSMKHMQQSDSMETDRSTTGSIKCDNSNANINSGCNKPGHLKQEERMESE
jgi:folate-dependent tRNA-U54 methylase TrmFO/GidA